MKQKMNFESAMNRLEEIAKALETGDIQLEDSLKIYEEGMQLLEFCQEKLNEAGKKVQKLNQTADGNFETSPLDSETDAHE